MSKKIKYGLSNHIGKSYIACVDLEATCCDIDSFPRDEMEIIEFGCTVLDNNLNIVDGLNLFVKPVVHPVLTNFCKELTTITQSDVESAKEWNSISPEIGNFFNKFEDIVWVSWGGFDERFIRRQCSRTGIKYPMPEEHYNLKDIEAKIANIPNKPRGTGLGNAKNRHKIIHDGTLHRASYDAAIVAKILQSISQDIVLKGF